MKKQQFTIRQGDVLVERIDSIPANLQPVEREQGKIVLAHGEVTGHSHAIDAGKDSRLLADPKTPDVTYLEIAEALTQLEHQEHGAVSIPQGLYRVTRQREYSPIAIQNVAD